MKESYQMDSRSKPLKSDMGDLATSRKSVSAHHEIEELVHLLLIAKDTEIGLRAQLDKALYDKEAAEAFAHHVGSSLSWRVGRAITIIPRKIKRILRRS